MSDWYPYPELQPNPSCYEGKPLYLAGVGNSKEGFTQVNTVGPTIGPVVSYSDFKPNQKQPQKSWFKRLF